MVYTLTLTQFIYQIISICIFMIDSDYRTLTADTDLPTTDEDLQLSLTMLFLTIKELSAMINALSLSPKGSVIRIVKLM